MGFKRKLYWLVLVLMPLFIFSGCGDLEPDMQDTRTVILKWTFMENPPHAVAQVFLHPN